MIFRLILASLGKAAITLDIMFPLMGNMKQTSGIVINNH